jgi:hypothetical protein
VNVKIVALVLTNALVLHPRLRKRAEMMAFLGGLSLAAIPFLPLFVYIPSVIIRNIFSYNLNFDRWGSAVPILELSATHAKDIVVAAGRYLIFGGVIACSLWNRRADKLNAYELGQLPTRYFSRSRQALVFSIPRTLPRYCSRRSFLGRGLWSRRRRVHRFHLCIFLDGNHSARLGIRSVSPSRGPYQLSPGASCWVSSSTAFAHLWLEIQRLMVPRPREPERYLPASWP